MTASDPRLTAYVLSELDEEEARTIDQLVDTDGELASSLSAIRAVASQIDAALTAEAAAVPVDPRLAAIDASAPAQPGAGDIPLEPPGHGARLVDGMRRWWAGAGPVARAAAGAGALAIAVIAVHDGLALTDQGSQRVRLWLDSIGQSHEDIDPVVATYGLNEPWLGKLLRLRADNESANARLSPESASLGTGEEVLQGKVMLIEPDSVSSSNTSGSPPLAAGGGGPAARVPAPMPPPSGQEAESPEAGEVGEPEPADGSSAPDLIPVVDPMRRVIKDGTMRLETASVEQAVGRLAAMAAQVGGYVAQTRWEHQPDAIDGAEIVISVPAGDFEAVLVRVRDVGTVLSEQVTSSDVSQEYVDLQSEVSNLEATRARIREFLEKSASVEEALHVNDELTRVESEIAQRKGRLQWLTHRSAMSTLTVSVVERPPRPTATPTPTATPPTTGLGLPPWNPSGTAHVATRTVVLTYRALATVLIWVAILLVAAAPVLAATWWLRRRSARLPAPAG